MRNRFLSFREYSALAQNADIALWRPSSLWGRYIAKRTGGHYSHVTGIVYWSEAQQWMSCGYEEGKGGFAEPLEVLSARHPQTIDIFRVSGPIWEMTEGTRDCVARRLSGDLGQPYDWAAVRRIAMAMLPIVGLFLLPEEWDQAAASLKTKARICSAHVASSFRACHVELIRKEPAITTPTDISQSPLIDYVGTLHG